MTRHALGIQATPPPRLRSSRCRAMLDALMRPLLFTLLLASCPLAAQVVRFAGDGALKMLYDNRMYPQAVVSQGQLHMVWRGDKGLPWIRSYDLAERKFSEPRMLLTGTGIKIDAARFERDQHYAPVVWAESDGRLHVAFGFHRTPGYHLATKQPGATNAWERLAEISHSVSYPQVHDLADGRTLVYFRESGHLGFWTYRTSADGGRTWEKPKSPVIDMDAPPHESPLASHAGSYQTTQVSADGSALHIAFIWKVEEPIASQRYGSVLHDYTRRHNLYYVRADLASGKVFNAHGKELARPVNFASAQRDCLVLDTEGGSASVGPSIALGPGGEPNFLLPVSGETPYASTFYFVRMRAGKWEKTRLTGTGHPFNSTHLVARPDGSFQAFLIAGDGETNEDTLMNSYGWGDRVEEWASDASGTHWKRARDLTPKAGLRYQSVKFVRGAGGQSVDDLLLFYAWQGTGKGSAYLLDERD
ncbi:MAG: hypothetical protein F4X12_17265 [Acidobacteriia bacterium]|nr:hypothetical protein [Terriglobia bacterium]